MNYSKIFPFVIALALPTYLFRFSLQGIPTTLLEIIIYILLIISLFNYKKINKNIISLKLFIPIIILFLSVIVSVFVSPLKIEALGQFKAFFIDPLIVFWLIVAYGKKETFGWTLWGFMGSSLFVSGYAIYQKLTGDITIDGRVVGILGGSPNYMAMFLAPIIVTLTAYGFQLTAQKNKIKGDFVLLCALSFSLLANLLSLYFSGSRAGILVVLSGIAIFFVLKYREILFKNKISYYILGLIIIVLALVSWSFFKPNFSLSGTDGGRVTSSNNVRWQIWETSIEMIKNSPILGVGLANYQNYFSELTSSRINFPEYISPYALSSHNLYLMFYLTTGLTGLLAFLWVVVTAIIYGFRNIKEPNMIILISTLLVILLNGLVDTPYFKNDLSLIFWIIIGLIVLEKKKE